MDKLNIPTKNRNKAESVAYALDNSDERNQEVNSKARLIASIAVVLPLIIALYHYLPHIIDAFAFDLLKLNPESHLGAAVNFFFYDTIKIVILLFIISSLMGVVNAYFPVDRLRIYLTTKKMYGLEYFFASFFGAVTPFCSCSSIPLFIGFVKGGIPLGVTFAYLITSPLVNEVAVAMFLGLFGVKATVIYAGTGILMGMLGGFVLGKLKLDKYLSDWVREIQDNAIQEQEEWDAEKLSFLDRLPSIIKEGWDIVRKVLLYVIIGIAIGAAMHGYVPENFFTEFLSADKWYAVPLAVILAVPMYANAAGIVPVIQVFVAKGVPLGTAIAFMMAVVGLSLPEATLLKKVMKWKLIGIFFGIITLFIIILGYLFNLVL
ncbi:permease [Labilibaculum filiforme]|uniref:permease n=1 Tax=Labilibaculum filiforme TaxID=1940526 RepID=UPI000C6CCEB4|nr:permease [Labilibaculum filiforme]